MKRRLATLMVFLLLGAVINFAVAWGFAWLRPDVMKLPVHAAFSQPSGTTWFIQSRSGFGVLHAKRQTFNVDGKGQELFPGIIVPDIAYENLWTGLPPEPPKSERPHLPSWSAANKAPQQMAEENDPLHEYACGWPALCLKSEWIEIVPTYYDHAKWGIVVSGFNASKKKIIVLPLRPLFPGFAINTLFYAALCWLLLAAPLAFRRARRRRRGCCVHCGYDLRGQVRGRDSTNASSACPECGRTSRRVG